MMLRWLTLAALLLPSLAHAEAVPPPFQVGQTMRVFHPTELRHWRGAKTEALVTLIWYPTNSGFAQPHEIGPPGHPILIGHPLVPQAPVATGRHPLILLSHGTGGSADSLDWLGAALAERGYLVVGVNHPGNNALEPLTAAGFRLWWNGQRMSARRSMACWQIRSLDPPSMRPGLAPPAFRSAATPCSNWPAPAPTSMPSCDFADRPPRMPSAIRAKLRHWTQRR
jgi:hypothetical protein